jgi:hypothetical protein
MSLQTVQIYVVATRKRPAIIVEALQAQGIPHHVCWTTDYKLEPGWKPEPHYGSLVQNQVGALRCYRGHQDALRFFRDQTPDINHALVLEDDAWPNRPDWVNVVAYAATALNRFELVSLHGRAFRQVDFTPHQLPNGVSCLEPVTQGQVWVQGSLAYLINRSAVNMFIDSPYVGYPSDLFICNRFKFALIDPSPFNHDRRAGSLIDCPTPKE